jgi:hypothetical protein
MRFATTSLCPRPFRIGSGFTIWAFCAGLLASALGLAGGQPWQFGFDPNGNLLTQTAQNPAFPIILAQPQPQVVSLGEPGSFFVLVADTRNLTYHWRFNGTDLANATNDTLLLTNVGTNNEGQYTVVLVNNSGSVTSAPAMLWFDSNGNGLPDTWELTYFSNLNQTATGDFDHDGASNLQEFLDGTNPTNSASARFRLSVGSDGGSVDVTPLRRSYTNGETVTITAYPSEGFHIWQGDIVTRSNAVTLTMTTNKTIFARFTPVDFFWTNTAGGDWNVSTNWTPNFVPATNDNAIITTTTTVTVSSNRACFGLILGSSNTQPTLTGNGDLTVQGPSSWPAGLMTGSGRTVIAPGATLKMVVNPSQLVLNGRVLENGGTILASGSGGLAMTGGAVITNRAGALFEAQSALTITAQGGACRFDNAGTFRKSLDSGTLTFSASSFSTLAFNNYGAVDLQAGTLQCNGSFFNPGSVTLSAGTTNRLSGGGSGNGTFSAPATALVEWNGSSFTLDPGAQLNGSGLYRFLSVTLTCNAALAVANLDVGSPGPFLTGSGIITVSNLMNWTSGTMTGSGRTIIAPAATLKMIVNPSQLVLTGRVLENGGTILASGSGGIVLTGGAVITNRAGALFEAQSAITITAQGGACRFDNAGTFRKSLDSGTLTFNVSFSTLAFNNYGAVDLQTGTLQCNGSFFNPGSVTLSAGTTNRLSGGGSGNGTFSAPATALVEWNGSSFTLDPAAQLNGSGLYRINGATLVCNSDLAVANLDLPNANTILTGPALIMVNNLMNWTGGWMSGSGRTVITPGATLNLANPGTVILSSRVLENGGTILETGAGGISMQTGAIITNRTGALFDQQNAVLISYANGGTCRFDNAGTFRKSLSAGTSTFNAPIAINNYGLMDLQRGILAANGGYNISSGSSLSCALGGTSAGTGYAQLQVAGTVTLNGALSVGLTNGFLPTLNDTFSVLTAGTRSGTFASFSYPSNQFTMQLSNAANSVIVRVTAMVVPPPPPTLLSPVLSGSNLLLTWTTVSNATYRLEFNPDLSPSNWNAVPGDVTALTTNATKLDALTPSNRFYRVRIIQ